MNKDQTQGRAEQVKGKVKEVAGAVTGDTSTEIKGKIQKNLGKAQAGVGDMAEDLRKDNRDEKDRP